jgi:NitT/TauT family transport system permease protein
MTLHVKSRLKIIGASAVPAGLVGLFLCLLVWEVVAASGLMNERLLPGPSVVVRSGLVMMQSGELAVHAAASIRRVLVGFLLAALVAIPLGMFLGGQPKASQFILPILEVIRPVPPIAWIPLAILWFGIRDGASFFIVALGAFFPIFTNAFEGIRGFTSAYLQAAQCLGASRWGIFSEIYLPGSMPHILTGLRIGLGTAWTSVIAAELVGAQRGLGYVVQVNRLLLRTDNILVGMACIGLAGFLLSQAISILERRLLVWTEVRPHA